MVYLTEMHTITILHIISYGDKTRSLLKVARLFQEALPDCLIYLKERLTLKLNRNREIGHIRQLKKISNAVSDGT